MTQEMPVLAKIPVRIDVWFKSGKNHYFVGYYEKKGNMIWIHSEDNAVLINYSSIDFITMRNV